MKDSLDDLKDESSRTILFILAANMQTMEKRQDGHSARHDKELSEIKSEMKQDMLFLKQEVKEMKNCINLVSEKINENRIESIQATGKLTSKIAALTIAVTLIVQAFLGDLGSHIKGLIGK